MDEVTPEHEEDLFAWGCRKGETVWHCVTLDHDPIYGGAPYQWPKTGTPFCGAPVLVAADGDELDWSAYPKGSWNDRCPVCEDMRMDQWRDWLNEDG